MSRLRGFADLQRLPEDERIAVIVASALDGNTVGVLVDDEPKADRYVEKLNGQLRVRVIGRTSQPNGTVLIRVGPTVS